MNRFYRLGALLATTLMLASNAQLVFAQEAASLQSIEQQIVRSQQVITLAKLQLEQLLLNEIPEVQAEISEGNSQAQSLLDRLTDLRERANNSDEQLARLRNQLERSRSLLFSKQQELADSSRQLAALQANMQRSVAAANIQNSELERNQQQIASMDHRIQIAQVEALEIQNQIRKIDTDVTRRNQQAIDLVSNEAEHRQLMLSKQQQLDATNREIKTLSKQLSTNDKKIKSEQGKWAKTDRIAIDKARQQQDLTTSIQTASDKLAALTEQASVKQSKLQEIKSTNQSRKAELDAIKEQLSASKKHNKAVAKQVRAAQKELADSETMIDDENILRRQLIQDTEDSKSSFLALQRNELDMNAEIQQLEKFVEQKLQAVAPLKREVEALRIEREKSLNKQSLQKERVQSVNETLVATDVRFQKLSRQQRELETERNALNADSLPE